MKIDVTKSFKGWKILADPETYTWVRDERETLNYPLYLDEVFNMLEYLITKGSGIIRAHGNSETDVLMWFSENYTKLESDVFFQNKLISHTIYKRDECDDLCGCVETEVDMTFQRDE